VPVYIPERELVPKTYDDDPIDFYYRPLTGSVYRRRLEMAVALLGEQRYPDLLEVGYGSGILLPELARHADRLTGLDIHENAAAVRKMLDGQSLSADLHRGDLYEMPFAKASFDAVFCLSVLEHLHELDRAMSEFARVARPGAVLVFGFPVRNPVTDGFFRMVGYDPRALHPAGHRDILGSIERAPGLSLEVRETYPRRLPVDLALYCVCRCRRQD
jgi:ubiquinone/menaquinone biosynthesis C-methylase UbiE